MKKILFVALLATTQLFSYEWKEVSKYPLPEKESCIFYDKTANEICIGNAIVYGTYLENYLDLYAEVTHWMPIPPYPVTNTIEKKEEKKNDRSSMPDMQEKKTKTV